MKRKRRIEITRYRRVTVLEGRDATDTAALPLVSDIMADVLGSIPPATEEYREDETTTPGAATYKTPRRRPSIKLRDLLRLRR